MYCDTISAQAAFPRKIIFIGNFNINQTQTVLKSGAFIDRSINLPLIYSLNLLALFRGSIINYNFIAGSCLNKKFLRYIDIEKLSGRI